MAINNFQVKYSGPESPFGRLPPACAGVTVMKGLSSPRRRGTSFYFVTIIKKIQQPENHQEPRYIIVLFLLQITSFM